MALSSDLNGYGRLEESITLSPCSDKGNAEMRTLWGVADAEQLTALASLLEEYANEMGLHGDEDARNRLAERILALFNEGVAPEDIRRHLDSSKSSPAHPE